MNVRTASAQFARRNAGLTRLSLGEWTPLMYAARQGAMNAAKVLLDRGANVNLTDPDNTTALVIAIINYHYDFAAMLLDHGADPNIADKEGVAALYSRDRHEHAAVDVRPTRAGRTVEGHRARS